MPDIDECLSGVAVCKHTCVNTLGSYICSCKPGYTLLDNGHCLGMYEFINNQDLIIDDDGDESNDNDDVDDDTIESVFSIQVKSITGVAFNSIMNI